MSLKSKDLNHFCEKAEKEYAWRIIELSNFKNSIVTERNDKVLKAKLRAGVVLLYAHWEGFIKRISKLYYEFVSLQPLLVSELNDSFISILLRSELNTLENSNKLRDHKRVTKAIIEGMKLPAHFSSKNPLRTGNLNYDIFLDVCILLGFDSREFEQRFKGRFSKSIALTIDKNLVAQRNTIAHGEYLSITLDDYKELYDIVINGLIYSFKEIVLDSAMNKRYLRGYEKEAS